VTLDEKLGRLRGLLGELDSALVAFSGGVDSTFLLRVAHEVLGARCVALTTASSTTPADDLAEARVLAAAIGAIHVVVETDELRIPGYAENPVNRCWFCKDNLFVICAAEAASRGFAAVLDGANVDDLTDHRPGLTAATEYRVRHPLVEAGLTKADVREASRALGLRTWDRPASPCLSSRFPYGTRITEERLQRVAAAERWLRDQGLLELRVRFHDALARIEVPPDDMPRVLALRGELVEAFRGFGFTWVALDLQGFRSGSLNDVLGPRMHEGPGDEPPAPRLR
jgi:pyridinium-3,5-biscarboxylic acid mononucleotide sulfurtransferase